jgi:transposase
VKTEVKGRMKCPHCGSGKLYGHGMCKPREILHIWSNGRRVYLEFHRRRWKCRDCKRAFAEGRELVRSCSRLTRQAEAEVLWQLKDRSFSQVKRELGVGYSTLRRLLEREIDEEALGFIRNEDEISLGIDEHSFRHQELVHIVTEVKQRKVVGILKDDRIATLKEFLGKFPKDKVKEVCNLNFVFIDNPALSLYSIQGCCLSCTFLVPVTVCYTAAERGHLS